MENEIWKDIPGYEGLYQASDLGRIRSLDRLAWTGKGYRLSRGKILSQSGHSGGYLKVALTPPSEKAKIYYVHRLIASAFLGESDLTVNHKNENKHDNRICNLEYMSRVDNIHYGTGQQRSKDKQRRTPVESFDLNTGETLQRYESQKEAGRHGYDQKSIWKCCHNQQESHKGVGWRFTV